MARKLISVVLFVFCLSGVSARAEQAAKTDDVETLKAQLAAQQEQIQELLKLLARHGKLLEALQQHLGGKEILSEQSSKTDALSSTEAKEQAAPLAARVEKLEQTVAENQNEDEQRWKGLGNFSFSGNLRVRYEPIFQTGVPQRHRERARLRFQVAATISKEFSGGFRLASGSLGNPHSTNQSFTGFFTRKPVALDQFWLTYKPEHVPWLSVTAGKFAYTWYRTELTFDNDLNPEGFSQVLAFDFSDSPLANLTLVGFQLPFNELKNAGDSFVYGGQIQTHWKLGERTRLGIHAAGINFRNADAIVRAIATGALQPSLPLTNSVRVDAGGNIIGYASRFAYLDLIAELRHQLTPRWPLRMTFDFVNNVRSAGGERSGYWAEVALGQAKEKDDWLFGYTLMRIERDAVIGAYNFDDLRASTNVLNHRFQASYRVHNNVALDYTLLIGRLVNPQDNLNLVPAAFRALARDPFLRRMQFDVVYLF